MYQTELNHQNEQLMEYINILLEENSLIYILLVLPPTCIVCQLRWNSRTGEVFTQGPSELITTPSTPQVQ
jgi:hypothetical protein